MPSSHNACYYVCKTDVLCLTTVERAFYGK